MCPSPSCHGLHFKEAFCRHFYCVLWKLSTHVWREILVSLPTRHNSNDSILATEMWSCMRLNSSLKICHIKKNLKKAKDFNEMEEIISRFSFDTLNFSRLRWQVLLSRFRTLPLWRSSMFKASLSLSFVYRMNVKNNIHNIECINY